MFQRKRSPRNSPAVPWRKESQLIQDLRSDLHENAYLLDLLHEYTLRGIYRMRWGRFYRIATPFPQILYQDATGLVVLSRATSEALPLFAQILIGSDIRTTRIIAREKTAVGLHSELKKISSEWSKTRVEFPEIGMALNQQSLMSYEEPDLRTADPSEAEAIAEESARAMAEEIGVEASGQDFERLVRSKTDLIERGRYYLLKKEGEIRFQAYLSARMPEVSQIQGVWVPPRFRSCGIATRCVAEVCRRVLAFSDSIVLRVQKRNAPARSVYEKVGFEHFLDYRSIWFD